MAGPETDPRTTPLAEYQRRLDDRRKALAAFTLWEDRVANLRLAVFLLGLVLAWLAFLSQILHGAWLLIPGALFASLIVIHDRLLRAIARMRSDIDYYERGVARIEDRWMGQGRDGLAFAPEDHPYASDLDVFGKGSLFQLLCTAQTQAGGQTLADWLLAPAMPDEIRARQECVEALRDKVDLREELAFHGRGMRASVFPAAIVAWATAPAELRSAGAAAFAIAASICVVTGAALALAAGQPLLLLASLIVLLAVILRVRTATAKILYAAQEPRRELDVVGAVLARWEAEEFRSPALKAIQATLREGSVPPSRAIAHLRRLLDLHDASLNQMFAPVALVTLSSYHVARAVEAWRARYGDAVGRWLETVGRLEALCSLASYAYEHPADPFPTLAEGAPSFEARGLGHPFLPTATCVCNDVSLNAAQRILTVSGSNMSGKSVLLRTVGVNAVLALAGAPVRAESLTLSPVRLGATMNVHDAILSGVSRFYAEIKRIRMLFDLAKGDLPLLFLLDELLHGTNSWDRKIGAHAILRGLLDAGAIGIVTTHDLAVTELAEAFTGRVANMHFEDQVHDDRLAFDYKLRPGVVRKSNALALMKAIGLQVD